MCSHAERGVASSTLLVLLLASACFKSHPCSRERCDGIDNDCDQKIDENFHNAEGVFTDPANCGSCGVRCDEVFPSASSTQCVVRDGEAMCEITECPEGEVLAGTGACVMTVAVACLPCSEDGECEVRSPGARCLEDATAGKHCAPVCGSDDACSEGFVCRAQTGSDASLCVPASGACVCDASMEGVQFACELRAPEPNASFACAGVQVCSGMRLGDCQPALEEACNRYDDDCDGNVDEDFVDAAGFYVTAEHCGACATPCAAPGEHIEAQCEVRAGAAECVRECDTGFVDRDGLAANGCECELLDASRPRAGADADCDGEIDPSGPLVFVSQAGDDAQSGTSPDAPVRTLARGFELGASLGRDVLVARGVYSGPLSIPEGIAIRGGYSPDFTRQDATLYPVVIAGAESLQGAPVLRCENVERATRVEDVTIEAAAVDLPGQGSTAVFFDGCGPEVVFERVTILGARAAPGRAGEDASALLPALGFASLGELAGVAGGVGERGGDAAPSCIAGGGVPGSKQCPSGDVGGGRGGDAQCALLACRNSTGTQCGNAGCTDFTTAGTCDIASARAVAVSNPQAWDGRGTVPGGRGVATYDAPTNHGSCSFCDDNPSLPRFGDDGSDGGGGPDGASGPGCEGGVTIDALGRLTAADGGSGSSGLDGSGGGGGSAGGGFSRIGNTSGDCVSRPGGAGGGGGSGGCGAPGGAGGGGGGGSLGVLIRLRAGQDRGPQLRSVRVVTASGGGGGDGGGGAAGGAPGSGGLGGVSEFWCARSGGRGGDGGPGGAGGGGGGGCGGPSAGVYLAADGGVDPGYVEGLREGLQVELAGAAGGGGRAGFSPGQSGGDGVEGRVGDVVEMAM
jgi:hypothetical protein